MKLFYAWFSLLLVSVPGESICPDRLQSALLSQWSQSSARLGVVVRSGEEVLVDINGGQSFIPASVQKLFTTAGALTTLGADFRVKTILTVTDKGELKLTGGGDPSFRSDRDLPRLVGQLNPGNIPIQSFQITAEPWGNSYGRGWEWADRQEPYAPPIGAVVIDENILEWKVDPNFSWKHPSRAQGWQVQNSTQLGQEDTLEIQVDSQTLILKGIIPQPIEYAHPIPDPGAQFLSLLRHELKRRGMKKLKPGTAVVLSPPLHKLVQTANKDSNNLYAEQLLRIVGRHYPRPGQDYETTGRAFLSQQVKSAGFYLADGSGLSRHNQATPQQIVELLVKMAEHSSFRASLPIGGKDGTLSNRLANLDLQAKTGTLTGISTLAGYLKPPHYPPVIFAILINHSLANPAQNRATIDAMVALINELTPCEL